MTIKFWKHDFHVARLNKLEQPSYTTNFSNVIEEFTVFGCF